jgi:hypothetical protein
MNDIRVEIAHTQEIFEYAIWYFNNVDVENNDWQIAYV